MKKIILVLFSLSVVASCFAQLQISGSSKEEALSSPVIIYPEKGITCQISNPITESSNESGKVTAKFTYPDGQNSYLTAPNSFDMSVMGYSYSPAPPISDAKISYQEIGNGFNVLVNTKNDHFKLQFEKKNDGGQIKVQCGEREWVIPFKSKEDINYIEGSEDALNSIYESLSANSFYRSALDLVCSELKNHYPSWDKDFRISVLQIMSIVFGNEFFDPSNISKSSVCLYAKIGTKTPNKITTANGVYTTLEKGYVGLPLNPGSTITIEIL
jgi:hypothetical protein